MITAKEFPGRTFATKDELFKALKENKSLLIAQKKLAIKYTDSIAYSFAVNDKNEAISKAETVVISEINTLRVKIVVNSCNWFDSHTDVSTKDSWNRTAKNAKRVLLLKEHSATFEGIISDEIELMVESISWKELGFNYEGKTNCLVFYATIRKDRNPYMFEQYAKGYVKEHSAGLQYVSLELCIDSNAEWNSEEKEAWNKYYPDVVNKEDLADYGFFWAVTEQKIREGSAVVYGSNEATPTIFVEPVTDTSTKQDSSDDTPKSEQKKLINVNFY